MYYFGIDLGGTNISAGLVDENYKIILSVSQRLRCGPGGIAFVCVRLIHITKK